MDQDFTLNNLIKLTYSEVSESERLNIQCKLENSQDLRNNLSQIEELKVLLDQEMLAPNPTSVQIILEESQKNELETY